MDDGTASMPAALMAELLGLDGFRVLATADAAGELELLAETTGRWRDRRTAGAQPGSGTPARGAAGGDLWGEADQVLPI